ncbi:MAG: hypothetical protein ACTSRP_02240 [Candidatus Helarchaeota archaeon]
MSLIYANRFNAFEKILKIKKDTIQYYREVISFLLKYLDGEFEGLKYIDNILLAEKLEISLDRASKVLSILNANELITKNVKRNNYYLLPKYIFRNILLSWIDEKNNELYNAFCQIFHEDMHSNIFREMNVNDSLKMFNILLKRFNLDANIYQETITIEIAAKTKYDAIPKFSRTFIDYGVSKKLYNLFSEKFYLFKKRFEKITDEGRNGQVFAIYPLKRVFEFILNSDFIKNINKKMKKEIAKTIIDKILEGIMDFKEFIIKNKFLPIIDFNHDKFIGSLFILEPHVFQIFNIDIEIPAKTTIIYSYSKSFADMISQIYLTSFHNLLSSINEKYSKLPKTVYVANLGRDLFDDAVKKLQNKKEEIDNL